MLEDLFSLEKLFGEEGAALFLEDVMRRYDEMVIEREIQNGHIIKRTINIGPDSGRALCWLSDKGRVHVAGCNTTI